MGTLAFYNSWQYKPVSRGARPTPGDNIIGTRSVSPAAAVDPPCAAAASEQSKRSVCTGKSVGHGPQVGWHWPMKHTSAERAEQRRLCIGMLL